MKYRFLGAGLLLACLLPRPASAAMSIRYALVVGNNVGHTDSGVDLEKLRHAEREAAELSEALLQLGGFSNSQSGERVVLLQGKGRAEILRAANQLAERVRQDRQRWGEISALFGFFFTGHGLEGKLLTATEPLTSTDLAQIVKQMGATFTFGMFDSCFSGSMDLTGLRAKGLRPTPGFNAFSELPGEVLNSRGTMWVVSSRPDQVSYEDDRYGGVFTHYFIEGMRQAQSDSFGISLEAIWEYASRQTQRRTSVTGRPQTPQKIVRDLTATGPVYFSFPHPRSAELAFAENVAGEFLLRYETGEVSEVVRKQSGDTKRVPVYPGAIWVEHMGSKGRERQRINLASGSTVWVHKSDGWRPSVDLGHSERSVVPKGGALTEFAVTEHARGSSALLSANYLYAFAPEHGTMPGQNLSLALRLDRGRLSLRGGVVLGSRSQAFPAWTYELRRYAVNLGVGPAWDTAIGRLALTGQVSWAQSRTERALDDSSSHSSFGAGSFAELLVPIWRKGHLYAQGLLGLMLEQVASVGGEPQGMQRDTKDWALMPVIGLGLAGRFL